MRGQAEGTIAVLLRHSTTGLVRRYAHLSPTHLKAAVETVASFGKPSPAQARGQEVTISNGTVTETVTRELVKEGTTPEVIENIGAGDGI